MTTNTIDTEMAELSAILMECPDTAKLRLSDDNPSDKPDWPYSGYDFLNGCYAALDADDEPVVTVYRWFKYKCWWAKVGDTYGLGVEFDTPAEALRSAIERWRELNKEEN